MDLLNFGNTLKELRTQNGMTQQQLATQIGVSKSVVSYYELQERTPSPEILLKLPSLGFSTITFGSNKISLLL